MSVIEAPVGDRRARDGGMEYIRPAEHSQGSEISAERPAPDSDSSHVEVAAALVRRLQRLDLVLEGRAGQVMPDLPLTLRPAPGGAPAGGDEHCETLFGQPLRGQERAAGSQYPLGVRATVGVEKHWQLP